MIIFKNHHLKRNLSVVLLLLVNFIFSIKYLSRYTDYYLLFSLLFFFFTFLLFNVSFHFFQHKKLLNALNYFILVVYFSLAIFLFTKVDVDSLNVDRWSVITNFWETYFTGEYAYFSTSNQGNPPGPMPFYFIIALPFYILGELGCMSLLGIFIFYFLVKYEFNSKLLTFISLFFICFSIFTLWEVIARSNVFLNGTLVLASLLYFQKFKQYNFKIYLLFAVIIGCLLSTRNSFAIAYIIYFMYLVLSKKMKFGQLFLITFMSILVFVLTFFPFVLGHFDKFLQMNPFLVQSTFLVPFGYSISFLVLAFLVSFFVKNFHDAIFYTGIVFFISIATYSGYQISIHGFLEAYFDSYIDISYFIFCIPFFLYYVLAIDNRREELKEI